MADRTFGERIVRTSFNPSEKAEVKEAKRLCAELIDFCDTFIPQDANGTQAFAEEERLLREAIRSFEEGCMWLVKGLTVDHSK